MPRNSRKESGPAVGGGMGREKTSDALLRLPTLGRDSDRLQRLESLLCDSFRVQVTV
jgi:hypothetical protein